MPAYLWNPPGCETLPHQSLNPIIQKDTLTAAILLFLLSFFHPSLGITGYVHSSSPSSSLLSSSSHKDTVKWLLCCPCVRMAVCLYMCARAGYFFVCDQISCVYKELQCASSEQPVFLCAGEACPLVSTHNRSLILPSVGWVISD